MSEIATFIESYVTALREENAAIFAGAGLSIPAGMLDWRGLLRQIASEVGLDIDHENDLIAVAQFHVNERQGRHSINQALISEFADRASLTENHTLLASLPIRTYWTTNYDTLIEQALRAARKRPDVKDSIGKLPLTLPRRDAVVYKMHGDVSRPEEAIVTRDDYEAYDQSHRLFSIALQGDLVSKTFLFLGFSFSDPNLQYILARIRLLLGQNHRDHYCLLKRVSRREVSSDEAFAYAKVRQELQVHDLRRYGIHGLLLDEFSQYTEVLRQIASRYRSGTVFVSGSAETFVPWTQSDAQTFLRDLGRRLMEIGFNVVSGLGLRVGSPLLNGMLDGLEQQGGYTLGERVILRPFPVGTITGEERAKRWTAYRREMVSQAGIALFLFGNKLVDGEIIDSPGTGEEFTRAVEAGLAVVPVGATGSRAAKLHAEVLANFDRYYPGRQDLRSDFEALAEGDDPASLLTRIEHFLGRLRRVP